MLLLRLINIVVKIHDTKEIELQYAKYKMKLKIDFINLPTRNYFIKGYSNAMVKYYYKFNHYGSWDQIINNDMIACCNTSAKANTIEE